MPQLIPLLQCVLRLGKSLLVHLRSTTMSEKPPDGLVNVNSDMVREKMRRLGLGVRALARETDLDHKTILHLRTRGWRCKYSTLKYVAPALRCLPEELDLDSGFNPNAIYPQLTRWGPADGRPPGIYAEGPDGQFIPWSALRDEIYQKLLTQLRRDVPVDCTIALGEYKGQRNWIIRILDSKAREIGNIWFGPDPHRGWEYDGFVRVGSPRRPVNVWQTFQRYSDGTYRRRQT
jgi:hypothetical protein